MVTYSGIALPFLEFPARDIDKDGYLANTVTVSGVALYRMRAYNTTSSEYVYWTSYSVDTDADDYAGGGTLSDIVVTYVKGKP